MPLAVESWDRWQALEAEAGVPILTPTGGLYGGLAGSSVLDGSIRSAREHGLPHEVIDADEVRRRWPVFAPPDGAQALVEEQAGVLRSDLAIEAQLTLAERLGASLRFDDPVTAGGPRRAAATRSRCASGAVVGADHLVIAAGAWITELVPDLRLPLAIERVPLLWVEPLVPAAEVAVGRLPVWIFETDTDGSFYGFPYDPEAGLKVARHHSGDLVPVADLGVGGPDAHAGRRGPGPSLPPRPHARRGRAAPGLGRVPVHGHAGRGLRARHAPGRARDRLRVGVLRPRLQVLAGDRRDPGRPRAAGPDRYPVDPFRAGRFGTAGRGSAT